MLVYFQLKTLDLDQAAANFAHQAAAHAGIFESTYTLFLQYSVKTITYTFISYRTTCYLKLI